MMSPFAEPNNRHIFLLRIWREESDDAWRVMLQHARTRVSYGFRTLAEAFAFIESLCVEGEN